jgi:hypothetical protein
LRLFGFYAALWKQITTFASKAGFSTYGRRWRILAFWQDGEEVILSREQYNGRARPQPDGHELIIDNAQFCLISAYMFYR